MSTIDLDRARRLGDRHLRPDLDDRLRPVQAGGWNAVRITASPAVAATSGGQHTLWMLANLLARQFAVVHELEIAVPPLPLEAGVALFGGAPDLAETLVRTAALVAGKAMRVRKADGTPATCGAEVVVGRAAEKAASAFSVAALGSGWRAFAGRPEHAPARLPSGRNALGPYFAACLAAGEVFKHLRGLREGKGRFIDALFISLWDFEARPSWDSLPEGEWPIPFVLPPFYLIGCGAVGQAVAAALIPSGEVRGHGTTIDGESNDPENLNRYPLATEGDLEVPKSELTAAFLRRGGIEAYHYHGRWPGYASDPSRRLQRDDVRRFESGYHYPLVLSCVDKNTARHGIQNFWPAFLMGGSTPGFAIEVNAYDMRSPYECLKCFNRPEPAGLSNSEIVAELRALPPEERRARAEARGADWRALEAYLADPKCGRLGEAEVAKFRDEAVDWSVGFVSVAAGTVLAGQLLKYTLVGRAAFPQEKGNSLRFNFFNPAPRWTKHLRRSTCDCAGAGRQDYERLWGTGDDGGRVGGRVHS
jgi:molybdopterin/thiamine biosynthesis adenylyltransferase